MAVVPKILSKIEITKTGCWEWLKCLSKAGYGQIRTNGKVQYVHRIMFEAYHGMICPDMEIDHLCRNRKCCNPLHLEQVTRRTNQLRGMSPAGIQSRRTHCKRGHEKIPENMWYRKNGKRCCRLCALMLRRKIVPII